MNNKLFASLLSLTLIFGACAEHTQNRKNNETMMQENPLMTSFNTPYETVPFSRIKPEHFEPAILKALEDTRKEIRKITDNPGKPSFENTVEALAFSGMHLNRLQQILSNLNSAETNEKLQAVAEKMMPLISDFHSEVMQNEKLFARIEKVYRQKDELQLDEVQKTLLEKTYKSFVRNGAKLNEKDKKELKEINRKLTELSLKFNKNVLHDTNEYILHINDETQLAGLPERVIQAAKEEAEKRQKEGWIFTLHYPSYGPFMKYAQNRALREKFYKLYGSRAFKGDAYDNRKVVLEEVKLRKRKANLLGYETYAEYVLEERMAETPRKVMEFLDELYNNAKPFALKEWKTLQNLARKDGIDRLQAWDVAYYSEKLKKQKLELDEEKLKPYFPLEQTVEGLFEVARKLYGIKFEPAPDIDVYHPDVKAYKVKDKTGELLAIFYADFFPRPGKRQGAWMTSYKPQYIKDGKNSRPHISIVMNFTKPTSGEPSLLSFYEVNTLYHEFGHALHGMLSQVVYPGLSGTNVYWDFVELPSQIMENWTYEPEVLKMFARHYKTGEPIPYEYIEKLKEEKKFLEGLATLRQLGFGYLDMAWHHRFPEGYDHIADFENKAVNPTRFYDYVPGTLISTSFGHLFAGGYAAGYYSYKWAELLDADAFSIFKKNGIFDKETAQRFRHLLEQGGTRHPMDLYKEFAGRPPRPDALLERAGFKETSDRETD